MSGWYRVVWIVVSLSANYPSVTAHTDFTIHNFKMTSVVHCSVASVSVGGTGCFSRVGIMCTYSAKGKKEGKIAPVLTN
jgi:hypothetical protein